MDKAHILSVARQIWGPEIDAMPVHYVAPCAYVVVPTPPVPGTPLESERDYWILKREREHPQSRVLHWQSIGPYQMIITDVLLVMEQPLTPAADCDILDSQERDDPAVNR